MRNKQKKRDVFDIIYLLVIILSFIIYLVLFYLTEVKLKLISYFIFVVVIVFLEGELISYLLKKDMLFFRINAEYSQKISIQYERYLYFVMDIAIMFLLIFFIFFNDVFFEIISLVNMDKVRGGILTVLIIGLLASVGFWARYFIMKWVRGRQIEKTTIKH
jgi:hypothetical protein